MCTFFHQSKQERVKKIIHIYTYIKRLLQAIFDQAMNNNFNHLQCNVMQRDGLAPNRSHSVIQSCIHAFIHILIFIHDKKRICFFFSFIRIEMHIAHINYYYHSFNRCRAMRVKIFHVLLLLLLLLFHTNIE